jgi:hypothetical protein
MDEYDYYTLRDVGYSRDDWIPVFQVLEDYPDMSNQAIREKLTRETPKNDRRDAPRFVSGGEVFYDLENSDGRISLYFGPGRVKNETMVEGLVLFHPDIKGDVINEKYGEIVETHSAPYLTPDIGVDHVGIDSLATIEMPTNYDQHDWEDTVDTAISMISKAQGLQSELHDTTVNYEL